MEIQATCGWSVQYQIRIGLDQIQVILHSSAHKNRDGLGPMIISQSAVWPEKLSRRFNSHAKSLKQKCALPVQARYCHSEGFGCSNSQFKDLILCFCFVVPSIPFDGSTVHSVKLYCTYTVWVYME